MSHYICTGGCGGVSSEEKTCAADECPNYGEPLEFCDCEDGEHNSGGKEDAQEEPEKQEE